MIRWRSEGWSEDRTGARTRSQDEEPGARSQEPGARSKEQGARSKELFLLLELYFCRRLHNS